MPRRHNNSAGELNRSFETAIAHGDLNLALAAAADLPHVSLERAVRLLVLMADERDRRYARAAARWMSRYAAETRDLTPAMLADVAEALAELEHGDLDAAEALLAAARQRA